VAVRWAPRQESDAPPARGERRPAYRVANSLPGANLKRHLLPHTLPDCGLEAVHTRA